MESVKVLQFLEGKTILVTGATGFLAKIYVEEILRIQPNVKKLYLLVRAEDKKSAMQRIVEEIVNKELFRVLRDKWGENLESFILEKLVAVPGDVSDSNLGVRDSQLMEEMWSEIDVVLNFAATTKFDERYDVSFETNTMGVLNVLCFAKKCVQTRLLLHVSTAYVYGERSGIIAENLFYYGTETITEASKVDITAEKKLVDEKLYQLRAEDAAEEVVKSTMRDLGTQRARLYGWPNTYVFTKAMGEMILSGNSIDNMALIIIRPTIITSTYKQPFPGWIEGLRTLDGFVVGYGKGKLKFLLGNPDTIVDLIPADMVINSIIMAMVVNANQYSCQIIYQVGSSMRNPLKFSDVHKFARLYFTRNPLIGKNGEPIMVSRCIFLKTRARFRIYMAIRYLLPLRVLKLVSLLLYQKYKDVCLDSDRKINFLMRLVELYNPYLLFKGIFDDTNVEKLRITVRESGLEADAFNFDPNCIDWEDYIINTHVPGLVRHVINGFVAQFLTYLEKNTKPKFKD